MLTALRPKCIIPLWGLAASLVGPLGSLLTALSVLGVSPSLTLLLMTGTFASLLNPFFSNDLIFDVQKPEEFIDSFSFSPSIAFSNILRDTCQS